MEEGREGDPRRARDAGLSPAASAPGLPRINDGSFLFLHAHDLEDEAATEGRGGSRIAIVFNGSPLFTGDAGSGESEIRRWIIENDWLEAIVALPDQLFYNTGIHLRLDRHQPEARARARARSSSSTRVELFQKMRKSLGNKRNELGESTSTTIAQLYGDFTRASISKIFDNEDFGYRRITVERPLRLELPGVARAHRAAERGERLPEPREDEEEGRAGEKEIEEGRQLQEQIPARRSNDWHGGESGRAATPSRRRSTQRSSRLSVDVPAAGRKAILAALSERTRRPRSARDAKGNPEPDADLRDNENVPLKEDVQAYFEREVMPHVADAWIDETKTKVGYEIPFTRHFYKYKPPATAGRDRGGDHERWRRRSRGCLARCWSDEHFGREASGLRYVWRTNRTTYSCRWRRCRPGH